MSLLRILVVHNAYQQRGGEDSVVDAEVAMLRDRGHHVHIYQRHNDDVADMGKIKLIGTTFWSTQTLDEIAQVVREFRPDLIHVHNTFPLISASIYHAAYLARIPVIQTLHNFRLLCPQATFLRKGQVCEDCLGKSPWRAVTRRCYRGSVTQSGVLAGMLIYNRIRNVYRSRVSRYIALNDFCLNKFIAGGIPATSLCVKPNFVSEFTGIDFNFTRTGLLFVGRLSPEKGISVLAGAFDSRIHGLLRIAGVGAESQHLQGKEGVELLGHLDSIIVRKKMAAAIALVIPSVCFETFGMTAIESFSVGTPVIASRIGALPDVVIDGVTGLLFEPGNVADLQAKLTWAVNNPAAMLQMGRNARALYLEKYTPDQNYTQLINIYQNAVDEQKGLLK